MEAYSSQQQAVPAPQQKPKSEKTKREWEWEWELCCCALSFSLKPKSVRRNIKPQRKSWRKVLVKLLLADIYCPSITAQLLRSCEEKICRLLQTAVCITHLIFGCGNSSSLVPKFPAFLYIYIYISCDPQILFS